MFAQKSAFVLIIAFGLAAPGVRETNWARSRCTTFACRDTLQELDLKRRE
jgi:hypothetical protein